MTTLRTQAEDWAQSLCRRLKGRPYVYTFTLILTEELSVKVFDGLSYEWLELIKDSRIKGGLQHNHDVVIGPVANDDTFQTITLYLEGLYTEQQAIEQLRYYKPNNQVSIHTQAALTNLTLSGKDVLGE